MASHLRVQGEERTLCGLKKRGNNTWRTFIISTTSDPAEVSCQRCRKAREKQEKTRAAGKGDQS
jgi:hypothetical protein